MKTYAIPFLNILQFFNNASYTSFSNRARYTSQKIKHAPQQNQTTQFAIWTNLLFTTNGTILSSTATFHAALLRFSFPIEQSLREKAGSNRCISYASRKPSAAPHKHTTDTGAARLNHLLSKFTKLEHSTPPKSNGNG